MRESIENAVPWPPGLCIFAGKKHFFNLILGGKLGKAGVPSLLSPLPLLATRKNKKQKQQQKKNFQCKDDLAN